jgi:antitoxin component YwqK of YwqJK toxin-antitoxin module
MKFLFPVLILFLSATLMAQADDFVFTQFKHRNGVVSSEGYLRKGKPDGYWKTYNEQGQLISEGNRKNFLLDSVWKFYNNEQLASEITYKAGKREGFSTTYTADEIIVTPYTADLILGTREVFYKSGAVKQCTPFDKGVEQGLEFDFAEDGVITGITEYRKGFIVNRQRINRRDKNGWKQGVWKFFYPDLIVQMEGAYLNDKKNGYFKYYDTLGNLTNVEKYTNDELEKDAEEISNVEVKTEYYSNGTPKLTATYKNGQLEGVAREYDEEGKIVKGVVFKEGKPVASGIVDDRGLFQNQWKEFYPNGTVKAEGRYRNGKRVGKWQFYFPTGELEQEGNFNNNGEYNGEWIWYHLNGEQHIVQNYVDGLEDGHFAEFLDDGETLVAEGEYIEGERHGDWFINTGLERTEGRYKNGERHGKWRTFYTNEKNKVSFEGSYIDGFPNGKHVYYQENGKILEEGSYTMGKLNGVWKKYDEKGQIYVTITYKNDDEIKYDYVRTEAHIKR